MLIDTGAAGFGPTTGHLRGHLAEAGIRADAIDTVVLTHGHPDHIGGNLNEDGTLAFPNARHVMFETEWSYWQSGPTLEELPVEAWLKDVIRAAAARNLPPLRKQDHLLSDGAEILPGLSAIAAPGPTVGDMAVAIESNGQRLLFAADVVLHPFDVEYPETRAAVDHEPAHMIATRRRLLADAAADRTLLMASHFPFPGLGYVRAQGSAWEWTPSAADIRR